MTTVAKAPDSPIRLSMLPSPSAYLTQGLHAVATTPGSQDNCHSYDDFYFHTAK
jgi:hypothetical protein